MIVTGYGTTGYLATSGANYQSASSLSRNTQSSFGEQRLTLHLSRVLQQLENIETILASRTVARSNITQPIVSTNDINIQTEPRSTEIESADEITRFVATYSPENPTWQNLSSAQLTVSGHYDGGLGQGELAFEVVQGGVAGIDPISISVTAPDGTNRGTYLLTSTDDPVAIGNGLSIALQPGLVANSDTATTNLTVDTDVSPNIYGAFNQEGAAGPGFEAGIEVTNGSFTVNGVVIEVEENDSIVNVLQSITASAAMVTASYDASSERIRLIHNLYGEQDLVLDNDTSGFLDATKLSSAIANPGQYDESQRPLSTLSAFSNVSNGTFSVNDVQYQLDTSTDSIQSIVESLAAPVQASLISNKRRLSIASNGDVESISLQSGSTQLFPSLHISDGKYDVFSQSKKAGISKTQSYRAADAIENINKILEASDLTSVRSLDTAIAGIISEVDQSLLSRLKAKGLRLQNLDGGLFDLTQADRRRFTKAIQNSDRDVIQFLLGTRDSDGFIEKARQAIISTIRSNGGSLDIYV
jgi:hypothetical protein